MPEDSVTIVSGLPRSGTSLMMQMLQAGGMALLTDGRRAPDEHNPRGYFEHEGVKHSRTDVSWLEHASGKAVKIVHLLLPQLPTSRNYRVIFMLRDLDEVIVSQRVMLKHQGRTAATLTDGQLAGVFEKQLSTVRQWLAQQPNFSVLYINHRDVIGDPLIVAGQINLFLTGNLRVADMAAAVDPALYRQRKSAQLRPVPVQRPSNAELSATLLPREPAVT
ncbi:MAG TPA: sulfotransferase domain-containing protein [Candidatus Acidoferrales bacterium]|nr:sulfotransferase domain-containing protein [Candidatus Acidoferrales bacterium]